MTGVIIVDRQNGQVGILPLVFQKKWTPSLILAICSKFFCSISSDNMPSNGLACGISMLVTIVGRQFQQ
jgi:hypothetical protein